MRPTIAIALAISLLAACFGAALSNSNAFADTGSKQQDSSHRKVRSKPTIDKSNRLELAVVRAPKDVGAVAFAHAERLVAFGPRHAASQVGMPGWTRQLDYIEQQLTALGLTVERDTWTDRKELITFTNLTATIPGKRADRILIGCHHDTKCTTGHDNPKHNFDFVGANDGGSGVGLLLALAPVLMKQQREATIELVFFDGEESLDWAWNDGVRALFGSKRYVKRHREAQILGGEGRIAALVLLDMVGRKDLHIQDELYSTTALRTIVWSAAVACGHQKHFFQRAEAASDDHCPFLEVGIPAVALIDLNGNPTWHTPLDTIDNMSPDSLQKVADVVLTMLPEVERAYVTERR